MPTSTQAISATVNQPQQVARNESKHFDRNLLHQKETKAPEVDVEVLHEVVQEAVADKLLEETVLIIFCPTHIDCIISVVLFFKIKQINQAL